ncbi:polysaccharide deacetylase family protein [Janibacter alittae]|uniref:Polysaccharide deacetylase family protein n=1 Tax=Janibacter alittae TaxID=3115209 RepID=A0ABZ2MG43_9MICO
MHHRSRGRHHLRLAALASAAALGVAGCSTAADAPPEDTTSTSTSSAPATSPSSSTDARQDEPTADTKLARARALAEGHDPEAALEVLADVDDQRAQELTQAVRSQRSKQVTWPKGKPVPHLFFHSLVVDPERAFDGDDRAQGYDDYMATIPEFTRTLEALLERDYVLVDPHDIATVGDDGQMHYRSIRLPEGTTPIVLSLDDLSYYEYMDDDGFPDRLVVEDGRVRTVYTDSSGKKEVGAHDVVPILDDFVEKHPEFSYRGAKGVVAMTGYDGVLGYRTSHRSHGQRDDLTEQQEKATAVATAMKEDGWSFASHTWGHITLTGASKARVQADQERWAQDVEPIVGKTDLLIYPFGADISGVAPYSGPVYEYLHGQGYDYFFNVDGTRPWQQLQGGYLRQGRMNVDGLMLRKNLSGGSDALAPFMDVTEVFDSARD